MPPRSPLPRVNGLDARWVRTADNVPGTPPPWATMGDFLRTRLGAHADVDGMLQRGDFVDATTRPVRDVDPYRPNAFVWFYRPLPIETPVPGRLDVLFRDDRIVVVDKPPFLATTPRGSHVLETVVARVRRDLEIPDATPAHRLDRLTSGVLLLTTERRWRGAYADLFAQRRATKTYRALAGHDPSLPDALVVRNRIEKGQGRDHLQARIVAGEPNAETLIERVRVVSDDVAEYRLSPHSGRTHQLRVHLASLGVPILGDPLYPDVLDVDPDDFTTPLQLLASELSFVDPIDGTPRQFTSHRTLPVA